MDAPHHKLKPLLEEHGLTWAAFTKRGRPPKEVREKRSAIVTTLHESGCTWAEMYKITGLSNGSIQRLTKAKGCTAVRQRRVALGRKAGESVRGRRREWLSRQLKQKWSDGGFDFHRGRVRSEVERQALRESWTRDRRQAQIKHIKERVWGDPGVRERLLQFHRGLQERVRRSHLQTERIQRNPAKYLRGRSSWVDTPKGTTRRIYARSSYEVAAVRKLELDPQVASYEYECRFTLEDGRWVLPDFLLTLVGGQKMLVEVKSAWVFNLPSDHKVLKRLAEAEHIALSKGWLFKVWTEEDLGDALTSTK